MVGMVDHECVVYLAEGVTKVTDERDANEAAELGWMSLGDALAKLATGEIIGAATVAGLLALQVRRLEKP